MCYMYEGFVLLFGPLSFSIGTKSKAAAFSTSISIILVQSVSRDIHLVRWKNVKEGIL